MSRSSSSSRRTCGCSQSSTRPSASEADDLQSCERADQHARETPLEIAERAWIWCAALFDERPVSVEPLAIVDVQESPNRTEERVFLRTGAVGWQGDRSTEFAPTVVARVDVLKFETSLLEIRGE